MTQYPVIECDKIEGSVGEFVLTEDCCVVLPCGHAVTIPAGFRTDYSSIPRTLWGLIPPTGRHADASVVHDWLYVSRVMAGKIGPRAARYWADTEWLELMQRAGVNRVVRWLMFHAVRAFGAKFYRHHLSKN